MQTIAIYPMTICRPDGFACMMDNGFVERSAPHCRLMPVVLCTAVLRIFAPDVACIGMPWIHPAAHILQHPYHSACQILQDYPTSL